MDIGPKYFCYTYEWEEVQRLISILLEKFCGECKKRCPIWKKSPTTVNSVKPTVERSVKDLAATENIQKQGPSRLLRFLKTLSLLLIVLSITSSANHK